jgi:hypothetical protein
MDNRIKENSIVQVNEKGQGGWIGCLIQVSEVKSWGIQGYIHIPTQGDACIRLEWDKVEYIGDAVLIHQEILK